MDRSIFVCVWLCVPVVSLVTEGEQNGGIDRFLLPWLWFVDVRRSFISLPIRWLQNDDDRERVTRHSLRDLSIDESSSSSNNNNKSWKRFDGEGPTKKSWDFRAVWLSNAVKCLRTHTHSPPKLSRVCSGWFCCSFLREGTSATWWKTCVGDIYSLLLAHSSSLSHPRCVCV